MADREKVRRYLYYAAIALMVPTFVIILFFRQQFPILGPVLALLGIAFLTGSTFIKSKS